MVCLTAILQLDTGRRFRLCAGSFLKLHLRAVRAPLIDEIQGRLIHQPANILAATSRAGHGLTAPVQVHMKWHLLFVPLALQGIHVQAGSVWPLPKNQVNICPVWYTCFKVSRP